MLVPEADSARSLSPRKDWRYVTRARESEKEEVIDYAIK